MESGCYIFKYCACSHRFGSVCSLRFGAFPHRPFPVFGISPNKRSFDTPCSQQPECLRQAFQENNIVDDSSGCYPPTVSYRLCPRYYRAFSMSELHMEDGYEQTPLLQQHSWFYSVAVITQDSDLLTSCNPGSNPGRTFLLTEVTTFTSH